MKKELTPKQKAFADEYIKNGGNGTDAARKAKYKCPEQQAKENLRKPLISEYIADHLEPEKQCLP